MFEEIEFGEATASRLGLKPATLRGLRQVVVLAGANGSGKSRYLSMVQEMAQLVATRLQAQRRRQPPPTIPHSVVRPPEPVPHIIQASWEQLSKTGVFPLQHTALQNLKAQIGGNASSNLIQAHAQAETQLARVAGALYRARHPDHIDDPATIKELQRATAFNDLLYAVLRTRVGYTHDGIVTLPTLFGQPYPGIPLSPGQAFLLTWAIALFASYDGDYPPEQTIVLMDEPELHLHPAAAVEAVERFREALFSRGTRQLWVATHSPSIVAHLAPHASLYLVENGSIDLRPSSAYRIMVGLLGGDDGPATLQRFLHDAASGEAATFVAQCFRDAMVSNRSGDRQSNQLCDVLRRRHEASKSLRVLDYQSGAGRFACALAGLASEEREMIDYHAFDGREHDPEQDRAQRIENIRALHPLTPETRCSSDLSDFHNESRVDVVVLSNVLHEIRPPDWKNHLSAIADILSDDGILAIFEDQRIQEGELPNNVGFIIFDRAEWRTLLGTNDGIERDPCSTERCSVITLTRSALLRVREADHADRLRSALRAMHVRLVAEITGARQLRADVRAAVAHARAIVQLANVTIAIGELGG